MIFSIKLLFLYVFLLTFITIINAQIQIPPILGGCGQSYSKFIPADRNLPFGTNPNQYPMTVGNRQSPKNVLKNGIWCGVGVLETSSGWTSYMMCSSAYYSANNLTNAAWVKTNLCGINYGVVPTPITNAPFSVVGLTNNFEGYFMTYNLCEDTGTSLGGPIFVIQRVNSVRYLQIYSGYPKNFTLVNSKSIAFGTFPSIYTQCNKTSALWNNNGNLNMWLSQYFLSNNSFATDIAFTGYNILSWNDDINMGIFTDNTFLYTGTFNSTGLYFYDSKNYAGIGAGLCSAPTEYSEVNVNTGYLYTSCVKTFANPAVSGTSAICQINMTTFKFIRCKVSTFQFGFRPTFFGVNNQLMTASGPFNSTFNGFNPNVFCISDPWNPVFLGGLDVFYSTASCGVGCTLKSLNYQIGSNSGNSQCFPNTFFPITEMSTSINAAYYEYCGSGVYNNGTICNTATTGSGCCAQNCTPQAIGSICANGTICTKNSTCSTSGVCTPNNYPNTTVCTNATTCYFQSNCNNGLCLPQPKPNSTICANSTACKTASYCNGFNGTCPLQINLPNTTICANETDCLFASYCDGSGTCPPQIPKSNNTICSNETDCQFASYCNSTIGQCPLAIFKSNGTICGTNYSCYSPDYCISGQCNYFPIPTPPNPINFIANSYNQTAIDLIWNSGGGSTYQYQIAYLQGDTAPANCNSGTVILPNSIIGTEHLITGLTPNTNYTFIICALNCNTTQEYSNGTTTTNSTQACPMPIDPSNATALTISDVQIDLAWSSNDPFTIAFQIAYQAGVIAPDNCSTGTVISYSSVLDQKSFPITGLTANTTYTFRICSVNCNPVPDFSNGTIVFNTTTFDSCLNKTNGTICGSLSLSLSYTCKNPDLCFNEICVPGSLFPNGTLCGLNQTECQPATYCDGFNPYCMQIDPYPYGTLCGNNQSECQGHGFCNGNGTCNNGTIYNSTVQCGLMPTECLSPSYCSGVNETCIQQPFFDNSTLCGLNQTECQPPSYCFGYNSTCNQQSPYNTSIQCGLLPGECLPPSFCNGTGGCDQQPFYNSTVICGPNATECQDPSYCPGNSANCSITPPAPPTRICGLNATDCLPISHCSGVDSNCNQSLPLPNGTHCGAPPVACQTWKTCLNSICNTNPPLPNGTICGNSTNSSYNCIILGVCDGISELCSDSSTGFKPKGTNCSLFSCIDGQCDGAGICNLNTTNQTCFSNIHTINSKIGLFEINIDTAYYYALIGPGIVFIFAFFFLLCSRKRILKSFDRKRS